MKNYIALIMVLVLSNLNGAPNTKIHEVQSVSPAMNEYWQQVKAQPEVDYKIFVAHDNKKKQVGFSVVHVPQKGTAYISSIVVDPAHQRKGYGNKLLESAENFAREKGAKSIEASCPQCDAASQKFFAKNGYTATKNPDLLRKDLSNGITIHEAGPTDASAICSQWQAATRNKGGEPIQHIVVDSDGKVRGNARGYVLNDTFYLKSITVHPDDKDKKYDSELLDKMEEFARKKGAMYSKAYVTGGAQTKPDFYRKHGYSGPTHNTIVKKKL